MMRQLRKMFSNQSTNSITTNKVWEEKMEELRSFKRVHGHCNVCRDYTSEYYDLALWLQEQKVLLELSTKGVSTQLDERRKMELQVLGFL
jgi:hypothetical protein